MKDFLGRTLYIGSRVAYMHSVRRTLEHGIVTKIEPDNVVIAPCGADGNINVYSEKVSRYPRNVIRITEESKCD